MHLRRPPLLLAIALSACGDSATVDPSTTDTDTSSGDSSSAGTTTQPASATDLPTSTDGSADGTGTTTDSTSTTAPLTSGPDPTTTTTGTPDTSDTGDSTSTSSTASTGDSSTGSTGSTSTGDDSTTEAPPCGPGSPGPDADGDGVPDECDPCPDDNPDDSDGDGVCDGADACPGGDDGLDSDDDGTPDFCDMDEVVINFPKPIDDYDVAADGALVVTRAETGQVFVTCYNGDRSVRRPEFVAGAYQYTDFVRAYPEVHIARDTQQVLVTWYDQNGGDPNHRIAYSYLDDACQPIATSQTAITQPGAYMEFHTAAIDALGHAVVTVSPSATLINRIDDNGVAAAQSEAFNINALYGTHVALNQAAGNGIVAAQIHSGNGIYYRRFDSDGGWQDPGPVMMPVNYHYWYDGFTLGMNDSSEFVLLWRSDGTALDMRFHAADGAVLADASRVTIDFEGWDGGHCYDSFRRRHQEVPLRGDNFILGEVYNWITPAQNRVVHHFERTPEGAELALDQTEHNLDEGLTIRLDELGFAYLRDSQGIHIVANYP
ncbi:MAG: hypothetical protein JNL82_40925 [Myxococcales bacterium]|nr:hypothetical protein [Myxococcales bacterium]